MAACLVLVARSRAYTAGMFRRALSRDAVLWWQGDPAQSVGLVESGRLGIRLDKRLLDVVSAGAVVGEASLLGSEDRLAPRGADVVVLDDDTVVLEHTVAELRQAGCTDVHRSILRSLSGQIARNLTLAAAANPSQPVLEATTVGLLQGLARADAKAGSVSSWEGFLVAFRLLYHLRTGSDGVRASLAPEGSWKLEDALRLLEGFRPLLGVQRELASHLERLLRVEAQRVSRA